MKIKELVKILEERENLVFALETPEFFGDPIYVNGIGEITRKTAQNIVDRIDSIELNPRSKAEMLHTPLG